MNEFRVVKRSSLPIRRFNGSSPMPPHAHYHKVGNLFFSKRACEVFGRRPLAVLEYDEETHTLKFTAVDKPPKGLEEEDCFRFVWHMHKGEPACASIAMRRLLRTLGFEYKKACDFPVVSFNAERHSIVLTLPGSNQGPEAEDNEKVDERLAAAVKNPRQDQVDIRQ